jgi:hypothetical protein
MPNTNHREQKCILETPGAVELFPGLGYVLLEAAVKCAGGILKVEKNCKKCSRNGSCYPTFDELPGSDNYIFATLSFYTEQYMLTPPISYFPKQGTDFKAN